MDIDLIKKNKSTIWIFFALIGSSFEPLVVKIGQNSLIPTKQLLTLKLLAGGILMLPMLFKVKWPGQKVFLKLLIISLLAIVTNYTMFLALENLPVSTVITLITTTPIFVGLINQMQGKVILDRNFWIGFLSVFIGIILSVNFPEVWSTAALSVGLLFAFISILGSTLYRTTVESLNGQVQPFTISIFIFLLNGIFAFTYLPWIGEIKDSTWSIALWLALAGVIANVAFVNAIHILGATRTSIISLLQRPIVIIVSTFLLHTPLNEIQVFGIVLVFIGVKIARPTLNYSQNSLLKP